MVHVSPRARAYSMRETETNQSQHDPAISRRISNAADFETYAHLAMPRSTARTVAKTVVVQIMSRRVEVTTGKNPDRSGAFNGLAFLRRFTRLSRHRLSLRHVFPVSELLRHSKCLSPPAAFPGRSWCPCLSKIADATVETLNSVG